MFTKLLAEHDDNEGDGDESQEVGFEFLIAGGDSAELLDFIEQGFDFVALLVAFLIVDDDLQAVRRIPGKTIPGEVQFIIHLTDRV